MKSLDDAANCCQLINDLKNVEKESGSSAPKLEDIDDSSSSSSEGSAVEAAILSPEDWEILLKGDSQECMLTFAKDDVILREGQKYSLVCQIVNGSCRIEKAVPGSDGVTVELGSLGKGEIFGEINFLTEGRATASVIADEEFVDMYFIDGTYLRDQLFKTHPHVVVRFYHYLCTILASRISQREQEGWGRRK
jgi:CRP-like cAMP-binding protein